MACYDVDPYTCSYDSGGVGSLPGGGDPDYSSLSTWEEDTDIDLTGYSGPVILDCYDSQAHYNASTGVGNATNTSPTVYREIRSSPHCKVPWSGKLGTGANFTGISVFSLSENYARLRNFGIDASGDIGGSFIGVEFPGTGTIGCKAINIVARVVNTGTGGTSGFIASYNADQLFFNCIALECANANGNGRGFYTAGLSSSNKSAFIGCVAIGCGDYGFYQNGFTGTHIAFSCYGGNNGVADFARNGSYTFSAPSGWNASKDNTADLGGAAGDNYKNSLDLLTSGTLDADGLPTVNTGLYANGSAGDRYGRNPYDDLSSVNDFNDFLKNDTNGDSLSKLDIRGKSRPSADTADSSWAIGAAEYAASWEIYPYISTYDSGGAGSLPGGGNPDYSDLAVWESDTDNDLSGYSGPIILDCYDSQLHNSNVTLDGTTNTSLSVYRMVRSSPNCSVPFSGRVGTGAGFYRSATSSSLFVVNEAFGRVYQVSGSLPSIAAVTSAYSAFDGGVRPAFFISCIAHDCNNSQDGYTCSGFYLGSGNSGGLFVNCISIGNDGSGFYLYNFFLSGTAPYIHVAVGCTSINNGGHGFNVLDSMGTGHPYVFSCCAQGNGGSGFTTGSYTGSGWCLSDDGTASNVDSSNYKNNVDLLTSGILDEDGLPTVDNIYYNGAVGDRCGRNPYDDFSGLTDLDCWDFFKNDTDGDPLSKIDIRGTSRPNANIADSSWSVGAAEYTGGESGAIYSSYDSGGAGSLPGGFDPDYSDLGVWEADTDNDLSGYSGPVILDCYDSQVHEDQITASGSTNVGGTAHRKIQSSANCAVPWGGKAGTGANFTLSRDVDYYALFCINESYFICYQLLASIYINTGVYNFPCFGREAVTSISFVKFISCIASDSISTGFEYWGDTSVLYFNCIAYGCYGHGFVLNTTNYSAARNNAVCCTAGGNGVGSGSFYGFYSPYSIGVACVWSCYGINNSDGDFYGSFDAPSGWCAASDETADAANGTNYKNNLTLSLDSDYLPLSDANLYGSAGTGENWGRSPYDDFSSTYDFDDFLKNDTSGESVSKFDIRGTERPDSEVADSSWAVGAAEYIEGTGGAIINPIVFIIT